MSLWLSWPIFVLINSWFMFHLNPLSHPEANTFWWNRGGKTYGEWTSNVLMILCLSPNDVTITNLIAGGEYNIHMLAESAFGRNSSQLSIVRSLYTDDVTLSNAITTHSLQTNVEFDSGVGSTVEMELLCLDLPLSWRDRKAFAWVHSELEQLETLSGQTSVCYSLESKYLVGLRALPFYNHDQHRWKIRWQTFFTNQVIGNLIGVVQSKKMR